MQVRQIAGMRGLVANPRGDMIPRPIKSNFREGLDMLEYYIATPGARKGLVDTALRTADSGYLTRRLVDVAQELIVNDDDPFDRAERTGSPVRSIWIENIRRDTPGQRFYMETKLLGRVLAEDVTLESGETYERGTMVTTEMMETMIEDESVTRARVLSPLTDDSEQGISALAYGMSLATGRLIERGEAVGVIAAQSIGEPGTQLTMRTFHTGGVASSGGDIAGGLPRVVELFEARSPKGKATLATVSGVVRVLEDEGRGKTVLVVTDDGEEASYPIPAGARIEVNDGDELRAGDPIVEGARDPKELLEIKGLRHTQTYLVDEIQKVYRDQGVSIHDKHIELIVRQMTRRVHINESGESPFLPGERVDRRRYTEVNKQLILEDGAPAEARDEIMGITKASLSTESWLSAASFQETTRVLTEAAIESKSDGLVGLKENIIIGKLIPAGTGHGDYRDVDTVAPEYKQMDGWSSDADEADVAAMLGEHFATQEGTEAPGGDGEAAS